MRIADLDLDVRAFNLLSIAGVETVEQIEEMSASEFLALKMGRTSERHIWQAVNDFRKHGIARKRCEICGAFARRKNANRCTDKCELAKERGARYMHRLIARITKPVGQSLLHT